MATACGDAKQAANWVTQDVLRELNEREETIESFPIDAQGLASLLGMITSGDLTTRSGREVFSSLMNNQGGDGSIVERFASIVAESGLSAVAARGELAAVAGLAQLQQLGAVAPPELVDTRSRLSPSRSRLGRCHRSLELVVHVIHIHQRLI